MQDYKARQPAKRRGRAARRQRLARSASPGLGLAAISASGAVARPLREAWGTGWAWVRARGWVHPRLLFALGVAWLMAGTAWGLYGAWQAPLRQVQVTGNAALTRVQIAAAAGLAPGMPMAGLDPYATSLRLMGHPQVAQAHVRRLIPGALAIEVRERQPAFLAVFAAGGSALIDPEGVVLARNPPPDTPGLADYPRLRSAAPAPSAGAVLGDPGVRRGVEVARHVRERLGAAAEPLLVDAVDPFTIRVQLPARGYTLLIPAAGMEAALAVWAGLLPGLGSAVPANGEIDLRAAVREGPGWIALRPSAEAR